MQTFLSNADYLSFYLFFVCFFNSRLHPQEAKLRKRKPRGVSLGTVRKKGKRRAEHGA